MKISNSFKIVFGIILILLVAVISGVYHVDFNKYLKSANRFITSNSSTTNKIKVSHTGGLSAGAIAGIVIGCVAGAVVFIIIIYYCCCHNQKPDYAVTSPTVPMTYSQPIVQPVVTPVQPVIQPVQPVIQPVQPVIQPAVPTYYPPPSQPYYPPTAVY